MTSLNWFFENVKRIEFFFLIKRVVEGNEDNKRKKIKALEEETWLFSLSIMTSDKDT